MGAILEIGGDAEVHLFVCNGMGEGYFCGVEHQAMCDV